MPNTRERLRTKLRRRAAFLVDTGSAPRRAMSAAETELFLWSIEKNDPNAFGLTKLSELRLNDPIDVTARGYSWNATTDTGIEGPMTLLTYAAWLGRAWIVRGLLRAGAVPQVGTKTTTRIDAAFTHRTSRDFRDAPSETRENAHDEYDVTRTGSLALLFKRLYARYPEAATWLVIAAARAGAAGGARLAENKRRRDERLDQTLAPLSRCAFRACRTARPVRPFAFATCQHVACEMCVWQAVAREHGGGFCCPVCDAAARTKPEAKTETRGGEAEEKVPPSVRPGDVARASRTRWLALPSEAPDAPCAASEATRGDDASACEPTGEVSPSRAEKLARRGKTRLADAVLGVFDAKGARKSFAPKPAAAAARRRASNHATREDRMRALLAAAASGDAPMVRAVVDAGVDVECADECGFTPLVLAAWRGRVGAARAMLAAGADPAAVAAGGVTAARAARANGHARVLRVIRDALGGRSPSPERPTAHSDGGDAAETKASAADVSFVRDASDGRFFSPRARAGEVRLRPPRVTLVPVPACAMEDVASGVGAVYGDGCFDDRGDRGDARTRTRAGCFLDAVDDLADVVSGKFGPAGACSDAERLHFADAEGWVRAELARAIEAIVESLVATKGKLVELFPGHPGRTLETSSKARRSDGNRADDDAGGGARAPPRGAVRAVVLPKMRFLRYPDPGGRLNPHVDLRKVDEESDTGQRSTHTFCLYLATCDAGGETVTLDKVREPKDPMSDRFAVGACKPKRGRLFLFPHGTPHAGRPVVDVPKVLLRGECYIVPSQ